MTTATPTRSAYPVPVTELLPTARHLTEQLGEVPSRNRLMTELRIGASKARQIRNTLTTQHDAIAPDTEPDPEPAPEPDTEAGPSVPDPAAEPAVADSRPHEIAQTETGEPLSSAQDSGVADPDTATSTASASAGGRRVPWWPVLLLALPAFVAIWSGWVGLGGLTGFGIVHPLPGIADEFAVNTAITLPIGMEAYAAYALRVWLSGRVPARARRFARTSALGALALGALGQIAYHLMTAAGMQSAPWPITTLVACLPVAVLGMGAALTHLLHDTEQEAT